jgi:ABC-type antimicrobial peptide transport system permease subunit
VLALVAMILCFFSLLASMVTNITEQKKEIGVLLVRAVPV